MKRLALLCALLLTLVWAAPAQARYGKAVLLFNLADARITESSGIASSSRSADLLFTHNDSGDIARFFAVGPKGKTLATYTVIGATAVDWEDMARGPGAGGEPTLFFADIGDNYHARPALVVYEVAEPEVDPKMTGAEVDVPVANIDVLVYEDGPHDAETLVVHPRTGAITVVTKDATGESGVYVAQEQMVPGISLLHRVATISFKRIARPRQKSDFDATSRLLATGWRHLTGRSPAGRPHLRRSVRVGYLEGDRVRGQRQGGAHRPAGDEAG
jgi:hypothetical protein